jgi:hypothetical protein
VQQKSRQSAGFERLWRQDPESVTPGNAEIGAGS